jgi:two-component system LytT family sensor kinase
MNSQNKMIKNQLNRTVVIHILCWTFFIFYELTILYFSAGKLESPIVYIYFYSFNILFFYLHIKALNFTFSGIKTNYIKGAILIILLFSGSLFIKFIYSYIFDYARLKEMSRVKDFKIFFLSSLFRTGYFATLGTFYWVADHLAHYRNQKLEAEKKQLEYLHEKSAVEVRLADTRNAYLQLQINPHMLFNALNFIYNSVHKNSPEASRSVLLLSDIMRFVLQSTEGDGKTSLETEVEQLYNLIEINRQRYDEPLFLDLQIQSDLGNYRFIPLILFTLTENLFKHGNLIVKQHPAVLRINVNDQGELIFQSRNLKKSESKFKRNSQIGIINIRTRMDYAYPGAYKLELTDKRDFFETTLNVQL